MGAPKRPSEGFNLYIDMTDGEFRRAIEDAEHLTHVDPPRLPFQQEINADILHADKVVVAKRTASAGNNPNYDHERHLFAAKVKSANLPRKHHALFHIKLLAKYDNQSIETVVANIVTSYNAFGPWSTARYFGLPIDHRFDWLPDTGLRYWLGAYFNSKSGKWQFMTAETPPHWERSRNLKQMPDDEWFTTKLPASINFKGPRFGAKWTRIYATFGDALACLHYQLETVIKENELKSK